MHALRFARIFVVAPLLTMATLAVLSACGGSSEPLNPGKVTAFVSVTPQASLVSAVGGDHVVVEVLAGPGHDPHAYNPTPKQIMSLGRADLWLTTRMPFERKMQPKVSSNAERLRIVDGAEGLPPFPASQEAVHEKPGEQGDHDHDHDHDHHDGHDHSAGDPHLWLSPPQLKIQAQIVAAALSDIDPDHAADYRANLAAFEDELDALHAEIAEQLAPYRGATFLAYHGAFAWFADAYGLRQEVIEFGGRTPETKRLREIIEFAKGAGIRVVFIQPQFDHNSAAAIAEGLGGSVVEIDPLAVDLLPNIRRIAELVAAGLLPVETPPPAE